MNYDTLYQPGRHYIWPLHEFVPFTKTVQFLNLDLEVYTKDDGSGNAGGVAGTPLDLRIGIQYLLIEAQVVPLFQKYNLVRMGTVTPHRFVYQLYCSRIFCSVV